MLGGHPGFSDYALKGVDFDLRKHDPCDAYGEVDFTVCTAPEGDNYARYRVRMDEMRESINIVRQCLAKLPEGDVQAKLPRNLKPPAGEAYAWVEAPRGIFGAYVVSDGSNQPMRVRFRSPSFVNMSALNRMCAGGKLADIVATLGSIDIVLGEIDR